MVSPRAIAERIASVNPASRILATSELPRRWCPAIRKSPHNNSSQGTSSAKILMAGRGRIRYASKEIANAAGREEKVLVREEVHHVRQGPPTRLESIGIPAFSQPSHPSSYR